MIDIVEVTDEIGLDLLEHEWRALADASEECTPFQTFEWMSSWWRHQRRGQLWILTAREQGALVGILPLFISRYHGLPLRRVSFLGTPVSDYHALLARPGRAADCRTAFFAHLAANERRWDVIDLPDLREGSALAESPLLPRLRVQLVHHRVCPFVPLGATWEGYTATLGKNLRSRIGRQTRALSRQFAAEFDEVGPDELRAALEDLFYLHNRRWQKRGLRGAFSDRRIQRFHQDVARRFLERGWLKLHRLRLDGKTRAAFYCFAHNRRVYYYLSGFDLTMARYSLGTVLMAHAIGRSIVDGAREFDLLRGDETYKKDWKAAERSTLRLVIGKPRSLRSRLALGVSWLERRVEREGSRLRNRLWGHKTRRNAPAAAT
ncbi:MAG TPA: GNAT family N-acetyltransferase [Polyangia bacterium]|nr:GNAT family N-acetyltransferase [Polyangia bacterium]